jgi:hypothetical protein
VSSIATWVTGIRPASASGADRARLLGVGEPEALAAAVEGERLIEAKRDLGDRLHEGEDQLGLGRSRVRDGVEVGGAGDDVERHAGLRAELLRRGFHASAMSGASSAFMPMTL